MTERSASVPDVRITGMGIVSPIGHDIETFTRSLADGKSGIKQLSNTGHAVTIGASIDRFSFPQMLDKMSDLPTALSKLALQTARRSPFPIQASVVSALQAWQQARLHSEEVPPDRIAIVIAGHNTTHHYQYALHSSFERDPEYLSPRYALEFMDSNQIGVLSQIFDIQGEGFTTGGASASGNVGIIHGARLVRAGLVDACLVVGVVADLSPMEIQGFQNIGAMGAKDAHITPEKACRPFDTLHDGFIYGQASACVVLESDTSAAARNVPALATVVGEAINLHASATTEPNLDGEVRAMRTALQHSGLAATDISYLNTHGSSSPLGDSVEIQAIEQVFDDHFPNVWLNATKGMTGHCLYSAGVVEIIATVVQMQHGFLHANMNLENPINTTARFCGKKAVSKQVDIAMSNAFGFGGINTSIVLRKHDASGSA